MGAILFFGVDGLLAGGKGLRVHSFQLSDLLGKGSVAAPLYYKELGVVVVKFTQLRPTSKLGPPLPSHRKGNGQFLEACTLFPSFAGNEEGLWRRN